MPIRALTLGMLGGAAFMIAFLSLFDPSLSQRKIEFICVFDAGVWLALSTVIVLLRVALAMVVWRAARARDRSIPAMRVVVQPASWGRE